MLTFDDDEERHTQGLKLMKREDGLIEVGPGDHHPYIGMYRRKPGDVFLFFTLALLTGGWQRTKKQSRNLAKG